MNTPQQWYANPALSEELAKLLKKEPLRSALEVLAFQGLPQGGRVSPTDTAANGLLNTRREGFYEFYIGLLALAEPAPAPSVQQLLKPWEYTRDRASSPSQTEK